MNNAREAMDLLQIRKRWVIEAIEEYDQIEIVTDPAENRHLVVLRKSPIKGDYWGILVRASTKKAAAKVVVDDVLKIPLEVAARARVPNSPLNVLEQLVERYGVEIQVGELKKKFFLSTKMKSDTPLQQGVNGIGFPADFQGSAMVSITPYEVYGEPYTDFVFGYAIDMRAYLPDVGMQWPFK